MAGVTNIGFDRKTFETIRDEIKAELRRTIDARLVIDDTTALGNLVDTISNQLALNWEVLEEAYYAFDPDNATGNTMVSLAALTGTNRRAPTQGIVSTTVNLDGGLTVLAGDLIAHEDAAPDNRWENRDPITTPAGAAANYSAIFVSQEFGSAATVGAGDLTEIAETYIGWNSITNATAATPGEDEESIEALRERRTTELASTGSATLKAVEADVSVVDEVLDVVGFENTSSTPTTTIPAHGIRIVIWDGSTPAASDDAVAQAIHDSRSGGIPTGGSESGSATAYDGSTYTENFDRATEKEVEIECEIDSASTVAAADVKQAILSAFGVVNTALTDSRKDIGADVIHARLQAAPFSVTGVDDVVSFEIRFSGGMLGAANLQVDVDEIATLAVGDITVTGDVT